ncbi:MAG: ATP-grasp domain-containing protein [Deltaproteobacteria bacterium]|nr:ATP-grasp domain-containing protein [Deltaproteobacteria bacterium]
MFRRLLLANRGEVAARVNRTCRRLGVETVAVVSEADRDLAWLNEVEQVVVVGGPHPRDSYLDADALLEVARRERCAAVHPGWGFLSENATFAARCEALGIVFVGPPAGVLHLTGDKAVARRAFERLGLLPIPGSSGAVADVARARAEADRVGWPVLLKAVAGGGGRGLAMARTAEELDQAFLEARAQAVAAFGEGALYVERFVEGARHVEFQILVDRYGNAVCLGERECSLQRRRQKVMEEAPSPLGDPRDRQATGERAAEALAALGYVGAGTVEMLATPGGDLWFLECNARLQVEHGITEALCGLDLVEWQLKIAAGERLSVPAVSARPGGHALECRVNAEDPAHDFAPSPGRLVRLDLPSGEGVRVDTHLRRAGPGDAGDQIPPHYDSLLCKIITQGNDRAEALDRMRAALSRTRIAGVRTNVALHLQLLDRPEVIEGRLDTGLLDRILPDLVPYLPRITPEP